MLPQTVKRTANCKQTAVKANRKQMAVKTNRKQSAVCNLQISHIGQNLASSLANLHILKTDCNCNFSIFLDLFLCVYSVFHKTFDKQFLIKFV